MILKHLHEWGQTSTIDREPQSSRLPTVGETKKCAEIGRELGGVSVSALSQNRARLATRMKRDPRLKEQFERLRDALTLNPPLE